MKYNDNGEYKDIYVKSFDTLPVGTEVDYDGDTAPTGWTEVADPNTYSTNEVRIGTWVNGKPIYKKTFNFNVPAHTGETYQVITSYADNNILDVIYAEGVGYIGNHACRILGQSIAPGGTERTRIIGTGENIAFQDSAFDDAMDCYATVYYTKTTD